jgi:hypothetical protein
MQSRSTCIYTHTTTATADLPGQEGTQALFYCTISAKQTIDACVCSCERSAAGAAAPDRPTSTSFQLQSPGFSLRKTSTPPIYATMVTWDVGMDTYGPSMRTSSHDNLANLLEVLDN